METKLLGRLIDGTVVKIKRTEIVLENGDHRSRFSFDIDGVMIDREIDLPVRRLGYRHLEEMGAMAQMGFASIEPA